MNGEPVLGFVFFRTDAGRQPVRQWLKKLGRADSKVIGEDIWLVQLRWPLGMPLVKKLEADLWEVRNNLSGGRIARVLFTVAGSEMVLLHGFIKKGERTPRKDLNLARARRDQWQGGRLLHE